MSKTKTTPAALQTKKYVSFTQGSSYAIDMEKGVIEPTTFSDIVDIEKLGTELSIDGNEYAILAVHKVDFESDVFKKNIEKAHTITHHSDDVAIYKNNHEKAFCLRLAVDEDIILVELM